MFSGLIELILGKIIGLEKDEGDIKELVTAESQELTTERLKELQT